MSDHLSTTELSSIWMILAPDERTEGFRMLDRADAEDFLTTLSSSDQAELLMELPAHERRSWLRFLAPDDEADLIQKVPEGRRVDFLTLLDDRTRREVVGLLAYAEDEAGGLMTPRYARIRPDMTVDEAISYVRKQTREYLHNLHDLYVLDEQQHLLGVVSLWDLLRASPDKTVREVMKTEVITVREDQDQESVSRVIADHNLLAVPVVDQGGKMSGIVTVDDIIDVVQEEDTEDMQKMGGMEALEAPYFQTGFLGMLKKRGGWLSVLFVGEMITASAMGYFEDEIAQAVVLALFIPLIISSGGNAGSQATTLIIRALALGEVKLRDWWRVVRREFVLGLGLGCVLGLLGILRILVWQKVFGNYGVHYVSVALAVGISLLGVVLWGTISGSMLPLILRRFGHDPANASAPLVATLVDVSGLVLYFTLASLLLRGTLL